MRTRDRVLHSLENVYRGAFTQAEDSGDSVSMEKLDLKYQRCLLYTSPSPRDRQKSRMPSSA